MRTTERIEPALTDALPGSAEETDYRAAIAELEAAQRRMGAIPRSLTTARAAAANEIQAATARVREAKDTLLALRKKRVFSGLSTPLHEACVARLDPAVVAELEADALRRQSDRDQRADARRGARQVAAGGPAARPTPAPTATPPLTRAKPANSQPAPEVHYIVRRGAS